VLSDLARIEIEFAYAKENHSIRHISTRNIRRKCHPTRNINSSKMKKSTKKTKEEQKVVIYHTEMRITFISRKSKQTFV